MRAEQWSSHLSQQDPHSRLLQRQSSLLLTCVHRWDFWVRELPGPPSPPLPPSSPTTAFALLSLQAHPTTPWIPLLCHSYFPRVQHLITQIGSLGEASPTSRTEYSVVGPQFHTGILKLLDCWATCKSRNGVGTCSKSLAFPDSVVFLE